MIVSIISGKQKWLLLEEYSWYTIDGLMKKRKKQISQLNEFVMFGSLLQNELEILMHMRSIYALFSLGTTKNAKV